MVFYEKSDASVRPKICAILAGYAWDETNPFVREPKRRLTALETTCA